ncbi:DUF6371 domain-containing protein [Arenibacter echinorum]|uniref:DUF6371 domain-containing protein n=1 Tax=Arenibacter echinorum TaxID=440515 RepID=UPI0037424FB5
MLIISIHTLIGRIKLTKSPILCYSNAFIGLYLIKESAIDMVAMVESEKTAIIMCILMPEYIWMATGSKVGRKQKFLNPSHGFK